MSNLIGPRRRCSGKEGQDRSTLLRHEGGAYFLRGGPLCKDPRGKDPRGKDPLGTDGTETTDLV
jgi:hypothetical protein